MVADAGGPIAPSTLARNMAGTLPAGPAVELRAWWPSASLLFAPACDRERLAAAFGSGTHAVVADLEDATPPDRKEEGRRVLAEVFRSAAGAARLVRVNAPETGLTAADLDALDGLELDALVLPKATPESVTELGTEGPPVIAIIESAAGLRLAYEVAASPRVAALLLGALDLGADLRLEPRADAVELLYARSKIVADSAAAGKRAPFDRVYTPVDDTVGLEADARFGRSIGFGGKGCTHVGQPEVVNRVFATGGVSLAEAKSAAFKE